MPDFLVDLGRQLLSQAGLIATLGWGLYLWERFDRARSRKAESEADRTVATKQTAALEALERASIAEREILIELRAEWRGRAAARGEG